MNLIILLVIGAIIGQLGNRIYPYAHKGRIADSVMGALGALEAGYLYSLVTVHEYAMAGYVFAIIGAAGFLFLQRLFVQIKEV